MATTITCAGCGATVPQSESYFTADGRMLCTRCNSFYEAAVQVERSRQEALEGAARQGARGGLVGLVAENIAEGSAHLRHDQMHAELAAIQAAGPAPEASATTFKCSGCGTVVARSETTYSLAGEPLCPACASSYDVEAEQRRLGGSLWEGFILGLLLSLLGVLLAVLFKHGASTKRGAVVGAVVNGVILYFTLPFVLALLVD